MTCNPKCSVTGTIVLRSSAPLCRLYDELAVDLQIVERNPGSDRDELHVKKRNDRQKDGLLGRSSYGRLPGLTTGRSVLRQMLGMLGFVHLPCDERPPSGHFAHSENPATFPPRNYRKCNRTASLPVMRSAVDYCFRLVGCRREPAFRHAHLYESRRIAELFGCREATRCIQCRCDKSRCGVRNASQ